MQPLTAEDILYAPELGVPVTVKAVAVLEAIVN
jgi:hypothetical protein